MREFIDLLTESEDQPTPCGTIVSVKRGGDFDEVTHYYLKLDRGWRRLLNHGLQGGVYNFEPTTVIVPDLDGYRDTTVVYKAPKPGERITTPVQILGFPETTIWLSPSGIPMRRFGDKIEYEGEQYGLNAISTMTRLAESVNKSSPGDHLQQIIDALKSSKFAPYIRVFGSAAVRPLKKVPLDIDIFIDASEAHLSKADVKEASKELIALAHKFYGGFDPFILITKRLGTKPEGGGYFQSTLWTRNETATGWTEAKNRAALTKAGRAGTPLNQLSDIVLTDLTEKAPPTKKAQRFIKKREADFKERYGKAWKQVLYATAWKLFGE